MRLKAAFTALCFVPFLAMADLVKVEPVSYSFDARTDAGSYPYHDWTGNQLIDGLYGEGGWWSDLGNGPAYEWVGWTDPVVNIDFQFDSVRTFNDIVLSTYHGTGGVRLPSWSVSYWENDAWVLYRQQINDQPQDETIQGIELSFSDLLFASDQVRVTLQHNTGGQHWLFVDEVSFYQSSYYTEIDQQANLEAGVSDVNLSGAAGLSSMGLLIMACAGWRRRDILARVQKQ